MDMQIALWVLRLPCCWDVGTSLGQVKHRVFRLHLPYTHYRVLGSGVGKMSQWLRTFAVTAEDFSLFPRTHLVTHNHP